MHEEKATTEIGKNFTFFSENGEFIINPEIMDEKWTELNKPKKDIHIYNLVKFMVRGGQIKRDSFEKFLCMLDEEAPPLKNILRKLSKNGNLSIKEIELDSDIESNVLTIIGFLIDEEKIVASKEDFESVGIEYPGDDKYQQMAAVYFKAAQLGNSSAIHNLTYLIYLEKIVVSKKDFESIGIKPPGGNKYQKAAALYRKAAQLGNSNSIFNLAYLVQEEKITVSKEDFKSIGIKPPSGNNYQKAAVLYCKAAQRGNVEALVNLAILIRVSKFFASEEDFKSAGIEYPGCNKRQQEAALYLKAAQLGAAKALKNLAFLIFKEKIVASEEDFKSVGIEKPKGDKYQQAAALYLKAAQLGAVKVLNNLASLICNGEIALSEEDFKSVGIEKPKGDKYQQMAALYLKAAQLGEVDDALKNLICLIKKKKIGKEFVGELVTELMKLKAEKLPQKGLKIFSKKDNKSLIRDEILTNIEKYSVICKERYDAYRAAWLKERYIEQPYLVDNLLSHKFALGCIIDCKRNSVKILPQNETSTSKKIIEKVGLFKFSHEKNLISPEQKDERKFLKDARKHFNEVEKKFLSL